LWSISDGYGITYNFFRPAYTAVTEGCDLSCVRSERTPSQSGGLRIPSRTNPCTSLQFFSRDRCVIVLASLRKEPRMISAEPTKTKSNMVAQAVPRQVKRQLAGGPKGRDQLDMQPLKHPCQPITEYLLSLAGLSPGPGQLTERIASVPQLSLLGPLSRFQGNRNHRGGKV
jgi:hypothetical protein